MTLAQMQNLVATLAAFPNVQFRAYQDLRGGVQVWIVKAQGSAGNKVTSVQMTNIANGVTPAGVVAQTDEVEFV